MKVYLDKIFDNYEKVLKENGQLEESCRMLKEELNSYKQFSVVSGTEVILN